jgi:hypothetical protein
VEIGDSVSVAIAHDLHSNHKMERGKTEKRELHDVAHGSAIA